MSKSSFQDGNDLSWGVLFLAGFSYRDFTHSQSSEPLPHHLPSLTFPIQPDAKRSKLTQDTCVECQQEITITVLPEPSHVKNVFHNILHPPLPPLPAGTGGDSNERLFIDCSTIDPTSSREVANAVHSTAQGRFVDAPMSGGVVGAQAGTLTFMLGFSSRSGGLIHRVRPVLERMGSKVLHLGGQGAGLSGKLANNYLLAVSNIATAEAMNLGHRLGLESSVLGELINGSSGRCWSSEINNPVAGVSKGAPAERGFEGGFGIELMKKDLRLAMEEARRVGARVEMGERAGDVYEVVEAEEKGKDFSVVYRWLGGS